MEVEVNYWAVVVAALVAMVVGSVWYMPNVFGNVWMKLAGIKPNKNVGTQKMAGLYLIAAVTSLVMAYVLAHMTFLAHTFFKNSMLQDALTTAFWVWLGFVAMRLLVQDTFEDRPVKLTLLNAGNALVTLLGMGFVIGLMR